MSWEDITDKAVWKDITNDVQFSGTTGGSATNNNPLNLEYRPNSYQDNYGAVLEPTSKNKRARFAKFPNMRAGYDAGIKQIEIDQTRGHTLSTFVEKFAPSFENPTKDIIQQYASYLGVHPNTPLSQIDPHSLIIPMLKRESSTNIITDGLERRMKAVAGSIKGNSEWEDVTNREDINEWEDITDQGSKPESVFVEGVRQYLEKGSGAAKLLQQFMLQNQDQEATQATINLRNLLAGPAGPEGGVTEALEVADLPFEYLIRKPLRYFHGKAIEPHRERTEAEFGRFIKAPGVGTAAPEATGPLPTEKVFTGAMELPVSVLPFKAMSYLRPLDRLVGAINEAKAANALKKGIGVAEPILEAAPFEFMEQPITSRMSALVPKLPKVEVTRPGWTWDSKTQSFQQVFDKDATGFLTRGNWIWNPTLQKFVPVLSIGAVATAVSDLLGPNEAEARVTGPIAEALAALAKMGAKEGPELASAVGKIAAEHGVDVASLAARYKQMAATGELFNLSMEQTGKIAEAAALAGTKIPVPPNTPTVPVPPLTEPPKSITEFADGLAKIPKATRKTYEIPDSLDVPKINPVVPTPKADMKWYDMERSQNIVSSNYFAPENNLVGDYHQSVVNFQNIMPLVSRIFKNMERKHGLAPDIVASEKEMVELMGPIFDAWVDITKPLASVESQLKIEKEFLSKYGIGTQAHADATAKIVDLQKQYDTLQVTTKNALKELYTSRDAIYKELAQKYTNVRVKAAAEGKPWALPLIKDNELELVDQTRKYLDLTKDRMRSVGMRTLADDKTYVPYLFQTGGYGNLETNFLSKMWYSKRHTPDPIWLDFVSRTPNSGDWFPLWSQSMSAYIPSVERKLAFNPMLAKWTPAITEWRATNSFPNTAQWATDFLNRNLGPESTNAFVKGLNHLTNLEYFHYLAGSISTAFLHLFKLMQTPIWHGFVPTFKAIGSMIKAIDPNSAERALFHNYVQSRLITKAVSQAPGMGEFLEPGWWQGLVQKGLNNPITNPTRLIESWDNGVNMFAALHSGLAKGTNAETINRAILETLMLLNFRGFATPRVFTAPGTRMLTMFQATPFKLAENKIDLIKKALTGEKDIYGRSDINKLVRLVMLLGIGFGTAQSLGLELDKHLGFHIPFTGETPKGDLSLAASPIVKNMATAANEGFEAGLKQQLSYWGPIQKAAEEFIPEKYGESKIQQILGVPNLGWAEKGKVEDQFREDLKVARKRMQGKALSPYEYLREFVK